MNLHDALAVIGPSDESLQTVLGLFDFTPNLYFFVKDRKRRFLWMNEPLRKHLGIKSVEDCVGKSDLDFFAPDFVFLFHQEDDSVVASRCPLLNQPQIVPEHKGGRKWFLTTKIPLINVDGEIVALAGIMRNLDHELEISRPFDEMRPIVDHIFEHYHERINLDTLASLAYLSPRQFERRFCTLFHSSPGEFIQKVRVNAAVRLLIESEFSVTEIALQCGFYDNSHFTRLFKKQMGVSPRQFRRKFE